MDVVVGIGYNTQCFRYANSTAWPSLGEADVRMVGGGLKKVEEGVEIFRLVECLRDRS